MTMSKRDNYSCGAANLGIGTTTSKVRTTTNVAQYVIDGRAYFKAATDDLFTLSGTALAANEVCAFFLYLDSAGTASVEQSAIAKASTAASGYVAGAFQWPEPASKACIGAVLIKSGGSAFTPGTTALTSVATYINMAFDYGKPIAY
jgi:hypothetical protein